MLMCFFLFLLNSLLSRVFSPLCPSITTFCSYSGHEKAVRELALALGFTHVSTSSDTMPMVRIVPRGYTACADAYLTPCIKNYVNSFSAGFKDIQVTIINILKLYFEQTVLYYYYLFVHVICKQCCFMISVGVLQNVKVLFMQSDGGLTPVQKYENKDLHFLIFIMHDS